MSFLNLGLGELLGLAGALSAGLVALYLLDRSKKKYVVPTLRFWASADVRTQLKHRRKIQQPWSLFLEIVSLLLLLLAIAEPQFGDIILAGRDHVMLLDASAWSGARARPGSQAIILDEVKAAARAYVKNLPGRDRVMIVRADAVATPATTFEKDRVNIESAIRGVQPGASALNLAQAIEYAERAQRAQGQRAGEIVYVGAGHVGEREASLAKLPSNLRLLEVGKNASAENVGLRRVGLRRSQDHAGAWDIFVEAHNYGDSARQVPLELQFAKSPVGSKLLTLKPHGDDRASFTYSAPTGGYLEARLNVRDSFSADDRAVIELPSQAPVRVAVYSTQPQLLKPILGANPQISATFEAPAAYSAEAKADIIVLDRFQPPAPPKRNAIWIEPPANASPIPVRTTLKTATLTQWRNDNPLGERLRSQGVPLDETEVLAPSAMDITVAASAEGPLLAAREGPFKTVVFGFHPGRSAMKYELATPLLFANILRWMSPGVFRQWEVQAGTVGSVTASLGKGVTADQVQVIDEGKRPLPFTVDDGELRFFSGAPGNVTVQTGDRAMVYSLTLPEVADAVWKAPTTVRRGLPRASDDGGSPPDIWPWLALAGGAGLLADWLLFGRSRAFRLQRSAA